MGYIYKIYNDINDKIYIGQTVNSISYRWSQHKDAYLKFDWHLYLAMRKYGIEKFHIEEVEQCSDELLDEKEIYYISLYDTMNKGYNETVGGDGRAFYSRELIKEEWEKGKSVDEISNKLNCWYSTIVQILKDLGLYNEFEVKKRSYVAIANNQTSKKIIQFTEDGKIYKTYNSVKEIISLNPEYKSNSIWSAITQKGSRYGYFWCREGESLPNFHKITKSQIRKIYQYDLNTKKLIQSFENAAEASKKTKICSSSILKCCKGQRKKAGEYFWSYEEIK